MIAHTTGNIFSLRTGTPTGPDDGVTVQLTTKGNVTDANVAAREVEAKLTIHLKKLVAQHLKWGQTLYVTISTEPPKDQ